MNQEEHDALLSAINKETELQPYDSANWARLWYLALKVVGPLQQLSPHDHDSLADMLNWCHKSFRSTDVCDAIVRLTDDGRRVEQRLCGTVDAMIWQLFHMDNVFIWSFLTEYFKDAKFKSPIQNKQNA